MGENAFKWHNSWVLARTWRIRHLAKSTMISVALGLLGIVVLGASWASAPGGFYQRFISFGPLIAVLGVLLALYGARHVIWEFSLKGIVLGSLLGVLLNVGAIGLETAVSKAVLPTVTLRGYLVGGCVGLEGREMTFLGQEGHVLATTRTGESHGESLGWFDMVYGTKRPIIR